MINAMQINNYKDNIEKNKQMTLKTEQEENKNLRRKTLSQKYHDNAKSIYIKR